MIGAAQPTATPSLPPESIAAIVLGGIALNDGSGSGTIPNVVLGVFILAILSNCFNMLSVSPYFQMLTAGLGIILAFCWGRFRC